jgi:uncharacterized protein YbjQ (UPF0145 family)
MSNCCNKVYLTASANVGIGLWTYICQALCQIFGISSRAYQKKLDRIKNECLESLEKQAKELGAVRLVNVKFTLSGLSCIATASAVLED